MQATAALQWTTKTLPVDRNYLEKVKKQEEALEDKETPKLKKRLLSSVVLLLILMYFSMGVVMWNWPGAGEAGGAKGLTAGWIGLIEMVLAAVIMFINRNFFISGFKSLLRGGPNMDTLVAMGSGVSFLWSCYVLFYEIIGGGNAAVSATIHDDIQRHSLHGLYFESAAMIVTLITVGKMLEAMSKGRTTNALKELIKMVPETAEVERGGEVLTVGIDYVREGEVVVIKPGERIPVDAEIIEGSTAVDESALTGESLPVDKTVGDHISAATINKSGYIRAKATRVGEDTTLAKIIDLVSDAAATKAPIARMADKIAGIFVPTVIAIAAVVFIIWMLLGKDIAFALERAIAVLVISCPCALGLATPVAIMVGSGVGAKNGLLFKTAAALEQTGRIEIMALDKTGTITGGNPKVTDIYTCEGVSEDELTEVAAAVESRSEHPLAKAICEHLGATTKRISDYEEIAGGGVRAFTWDGNHAVRIAGGNAAFMEENNVKTEAVEQLSKETADLANAGKTSVLFCKGGKLLGLIALADSVREDSKDAIGKLKELGIRTVMLTGDKQQTAEAIAAEVGVDEVVAAVLPDGKEEVVRNLMEQGVTAMVGDGINDAPALTRANVGIAIGAGTDVAIEAADVVLSGSSLTEAVKAVKLGRGTLRNIKENLFWAFIYNILLIPLAAGAYTGLFHGWTLSPMIGAAAMSLSSFCVCMNALRLNLIKLD